MDFLQPNFPIYVGLIWGGYFFMSPQPLSSCRKLAVVLPQACGLYRRKLAVVSPQAHNWSPCKVWPWFFNFDILVQVRVVVSGISTSLHSRNAIAAAYFVPFLALWGPAASAKSGKSSKAAIVAPLSDGFFATKLYNLCWTYLGRIFFSVPATFV